MFLIIIKREGAFLMIPINDFIECSIRFAKRLEINKCVDLRPYKRDRSVIIEKSINGYNVYEDGFHRENYKDLSIQELEKLLKVIKKREFPRSNIVRTSFLNKRPENV